MTKKELHPSVQQFKQFVKTNPKVVQEVRKGKVTWQELFEEWYLLGEEDSRWDKYREGNTTADAQTTKDTSTKDWMSNIMNAMKNMDPNQMQGHITSLSQAIGAIQGVVAQFQGGAQPKSSPPQSTQQPQHPFQFRKD